MRAVRLKSARRQRRVQRVRKKLMGTGERPRLAVARSHRQIAAQIIDDIAGRTLCAVASDGPDLGDTLKYGGNIAAAKQVGKLLGEKAKALGIQAVCFDRRGRAYHGRIKALADAAREAGLKF
jgi:large subunit ribosomal protein L18